MPAKKLFVIYDSECGLCARTVNWIASHDREAKFRFVSARSDIAARTLAALRPGLDPFTGVRFPLRYVGIRLDYSFSTLCSGR